MGEILVVLLVVWGFSANAQMFEILIGRVPDPSGPLSTALAVVLIAAVALTRPRGSTMAVRISIPILLWIGLWIMSVTWSWNFWVWFADARVSLVMIAAGMFVAGVVDVDRIARGLCTGVYVALALTVVASLAGGIDEGGAWHGAFFHKNEMGGFMAIAILVIVQLESRATWRIGGIMVAMGLAVLAQSATALLMIGAGAATAVILRRVASLPHRQATAYFFSVVTLVMLVLVSLAVQYATVVTGLGRDNTLTGRTDIWPAAWDMIQVRPWIGWGPGVWIQQNADPARYIGAEAGFNVGHSHNTVLEVLLLWGVLGLVLYLGVVVALARSAWRLVRIELRWATLSLGFVAVLLVQSISEPALRGWMGMMALLHVLMQRLWDEHRRTTVTTAVDDLDMDRLVR
jgi:exopolysaccharide production protein ExoQ